MTTQPPPVAPLTTEELAALRHQHRPDAPRWDGLQECAACQFGLWSNCPVARLLATVDSERALLDDLVLSQEARDDDH